MTSKIITDYLRDLAERLRKEYASQAISFINDDDAEHLIDLADMLDEERDCK